MGWLHAAPKVKDQTTEPRINTFAEDSPYRELPDTDRCEDIVNAFHRVGRVTNTGMGSTPVSWSEIDAFNRMSGAGLDCWAASQVRTMSEVYCSSLSSSECDKSEAPYLPEWACAIETMRNEVNRSFLAMRESRKNLSPSK